MEIAILLCLTAASMSKVRWRNFMMATIIICHAKNALGLQQGNLTEFQYFY
jgi:hypothetical protein